MTMIVYSKRDRALMVDSGVVVNYNSANARIDSSLRKMYMTNDCRFVIATTGFILHDMEREAFERVIIPRIELYMKDRSVKSLEFNKEEHLAHGLCHQTTVIMTSVGLFIFSVNAANTWMFFEPLTEDFVSGASTIYFHSAQILGMSPVEAFAYAVGRCDNSRLPMNVYSVDSLAPLVPVVPAVVEEAVE